MSTLGTGWGRERQDDTNAPREPTPLRLEFCIRCGFSNSFLIPTSFLGPDQFSKAENLKENLCVLVPDI